MYRIQNLRLPFASFLVFCLFLILAVSVQMQSQEEPLLTVPADESDMGEMVDETPQLWFVEMPSAPTVDGTSLTTTRQEKTTFRNNARQAGLRYTERFAFDRLWNGLAIRIDRSQLSKLSNISGVKNIYPVETISLPANAPVADAQGVSDPNLYTAIAMTGANIAQSNLGLTGQGIKVGVIDSGVDYNHADLGGCFGAGCRVAKGYDFVGNAYDANSNNPTYNPNPVPDNDPDDCGGHGTHVAGIVGANGTVKGVAPNVTFGAYRVFGCVGSTSSDIIIAAMEQALTDGMQVVNMSIGSSFQWPQYPTAQASDRLVNKGVVVVASIGNSGTSGLYAAGAPGVGSKVIGVASFDNSHVRLPVFTISSDNTAIGYNPATSAPAPPTSGTVPMARTGTSTSTADACSALPAGSLTGKVALIRRGTCGFHVKAINAQNAGAAGVVIYNNAPGRQSITVAGSPAVTIPVVSTSDTEGVLINNRLAAETVNMTWTNQISSFPNTATGNLISSFSSYGMAADLSLKPDIGAPGGQIFSTYPVELGSYATLNGTSMSSPHVAGAVALLLQAKPNTPSNAVRSILQNTASPKAWWGNPASGFLDNVHRQGAGMLQIDKAVQATTRIEPGKLSLGESESGPSTRTLTVTNSSSAPVVYDLSHTGALATGPNTFTVAFFSAFASASFSQLGVPVSSLTVPARSSATVDITIAAPASLADRGTYGGYVVFTPQSGGQAYRVPYAGLKGDYQSIPVLTPTANNFPWLSKLNGGSFFNQSGGATYTMQNGDIPYVVAHFDHQSRRFLMEVFEATTGNTWHRAYIEEYLPRNSTSTGIFAFPWDGTTRNGSKTFTVPNGQYVIRVSVAKALGDSANPAHTETWTSPVITVARP